MRKAVKQIIDPRNVKAAFAKLKCHLMEVKILSHIKQDVVSVIFHW